MIPTLIIAAWAVGVFIDLCTTLMAAVTDDEPIGPMFLSIATACALCWPITLTGDALQKLQDRRRRAKGPDHG